MNGSDEPESANRPQAVVYREPPKSLPNYGGHTSSPMAWTARLSWIRSPGTPCGLHCPSDDYQADHFDEFGFHSPWGIEVFIAVPARRETVISLTLLTK
jgi:hypothetical protein